MAKNSALPLLLIGGAAVVLAGKKKKKRSLSSAPAPSGSLAGYPTPQPTAPPSGGVRPPSDLPSQQPPPVKPPEQKADPNDPGIPHVEYYPSVQQLMNARAWAISERPVQNYFALLIKNMKGLSEGAQEAMYEWAEENWGDANNVGWTLMIAPTPPSSPDEYAIEIYRNELGDLSQYFFYVFAAPDELLGRDAATWTKQEVRAALDGAVGELPPEAFDKLLEAAQAAEAGS